MELKCTFRDLFGIRIESRGVNVDVWRQNSINDSSQSGRNHT